MTRVNKSRTSAKRTILCTCVVLVPLLASSLLQAASLAVIPVSFAETPASLDQATKLAAALSAKDYQVLSQEQVVKRLLQSRWPAAINIDKLSQELDADSLGQIDLDKMVTRLQEIVEILQNDPAPSEAKTKLLQRARLMLARSLYHLAFLTGDRKRNLDIQRRIFVNLEAAVRSDPFVTMPLDKFSPELRRLLDQARARVVKAGTGRLELHCDRKAGDVFIDGRQLGQCPLFIDDQQPLGKYRVWVKSPNCRSRTHLITIARGLNRVEINMAFDCAVDPNDGTMHMAENALISDSMAIDAGRALGVDLLVIYGVLPRDDGEWAFAALYDIHSGQALRRGAVRLQEPVQQQIDQLATFLHQPRTSETQISKTRLPFSLPVEGQAEAAGNSQTAQSMGFAVKEPLKLAAMISGGVAGLGLVGSAVGMTIWALAYQGLAQPFVPRNEIDGLQAQANLGWNIAGLSAAVSLLGGLSSGGFLLYRQLQQDAQQAGKDQDTERATSGPDTDDPAPETKQDDPNTIDAPPQGPVPSLGFLQKHQLQHRPQHRPAHYSEPADRGSLSC